MPDGARRRLPGVGLALLAVLLVGLPVLTLVLRAFADVWRAPALWPQEFGTRGFSDAFSGGAGAGEAVVNSLVVALGSTALALVLAWPAARALGERRVRRPALVWIVLALPLLVPPFATGTGLTEWFIRLGLTDSRLGLVLAHLVPVLPYVVLILTAAFGPRVRELEEAARVHGAGAVRRLALVTVPAVLPVLALAALLGFLVSWSQYGISLAIGAGLPMLPVILVPFVGSDLQVAAALSLIFLGPAVLALAAAAWATTRWGRA